MILSAVLENSKFHHFVLESDEVIEIIVMFATGHTIQPYYVVAGTDAQVGFSKFACMGNLYC